MTDTTRQLPGKLPWPHEWDELPVAKYYFAAIFFFIFGCIGIGAAVSIFLPGFNDSRAYLVALGIPLFFGIIGDLIITRLRLRRRDAAKAHCGPVAELGEIGLVLPYSRPLAVIYTVGLVFLLLVFLLLFTSALLVVAADGTHNLIDLIQAVLSGVLTLAAAAQVLDLARRKLRRGQLALTPSGVYHDGWSFSCFVPWEDVMYVSARDGDGPVIALATADTDRQWYRRRTRLRRPPEMAYAPNIGIQARYLTVDPALAYHALRFYRAHPDARAELGTVTGAQRVRSGTVVAA
ncbi:MAG: hypothetical protein ACRDQ5_14885 [Sciscionella sp.]